MFEVLGPNLVIKHFWELLHVLYSHKIIHYNKGSHFYVLKENGSLGVVFYVEA